MTTPPSHRSPSSAHDGFDLSDSLDALEVAASVVAPALGSDLAELATRGVVILQALGEALIAAEKDERPELLSDAIADAVQRQALGAAAYTAPSDVDAILVRVGPVVGREAVRTLKALLKREAAAIEDEHGQREAVTQEASIHAMLVKAGLGDEIPRGLRAPPGYAISADGVTLGRGEDAEVVALRPIVVLGSSEDYTTRTVSLRLAWATPARSWVVRDVPREVVVDGRRILALAAMGAPIHSGSGGNIARYLSSFEAANGSRLPAAVTTDRLGWHGDEFVPFSDQVRFVALPGAGEGQIAAAISSHGTLDGWLDRLIAAPPLVQLLMVASASTPLLMRAESPGFVFSLDGTSARGKTVALLAGVTAWGPPRSALCATWEDTKVNIMARAAVLHSIPVWLDDTKHAQNDPEKIAETIYAISGGRERGRGTKEGTMRMARTWRTGLISTGEQRITDFSSDLGTRGRVLSFFQSPFRTAEDAIAYVEGIEDHYGLAGPHIAQWAVRAPVHDLHRAMVDRLVADSPGIGPLGRRLLPHVALFELAADVLGVRADLDEAFRLAMVAAQGVDEASDVHREAFDDLMSWCVSNGSRFYPRFGPPKPREPVGGWLGVSEHDFICPLASVAREQLARMGHRPQECFAVWAEKGWMDAGTDRNERYRSIDSKSVRVFVLKRQE